MKIILLLLIATITSNAQSYRAYKDTKGEWRVQTIHVSSNGGYTSYFSEIKDSITVANEVFNLKRISDEGALYDSLSIDNEYAIYESIKKVDGFSMSELLKGFGATQFIGDWVLINKVTQDTLAISITRTYNIRGKANGKIVLLSGGRVRIDGIYSSNVIMKSSENNKFLFGTLSGQRIELKRN